MKKFLTRVFITIGFAIAVFIVLGVLSSIFLSNSFVVRTWGAFLGNISSQCQEAGLLFCQFLANAVLALLIGVILSIRHYGNKTLWDRIDRKIKVALIVLTLSVLGSVLLKILFGALKI